MKNVFYKPWVGKSYNTCIPKIMVLGESVYGDTPKAEKENFVCNMILSVSTGQWNKSFFTILKTFLEQLDVNWGNGNKSIWEEIIFYEYVQEPLESSRIRPSKMQWDNSIKGFVEILKEYKPDIVLAIGKQMYGLLPELNGSIYKQQEVTYKDKKYSSECWRYNISGKYIFMVELKHISAGFSYAPWVTMVNNLIPEII